jgi:hypothetical protein
VKVEPKSHGDTVLYMLRELQPAGPVQASTRVAVRSFPAETNMLCLAMS